MEKIILENLKNNTSLNRYETDIFVDKKNIPILIDATAIEIQKSIDLANKIISNFEFYEKKARTKIVKEYLDDYNENWRDADEGEPELNEIEFTKDMVLENISIGDDSISIDFFYSGNGMFGNHSLIAQSFDGENFEHYTMFG